MSINSIQGVDNFLFVLFPSIKGRKKVHTVPPSLASGTSVKTTFVNITKLNFYAIWLSYFLSFVCR